MSLDAHRYSTYYKKIHTILLRCMQPFFVGFYLDFKKRLFYKSLWTNSIFFVLFTSFLDSITFYHRSINGILISLLSIAYKSIFWRVNGQNDVDLFGIYGHITFQILWYAPQVYSLSTIAGTIGKKNVRYFFLYCTTSTDNYIDSKSKV